MSTISSISSNFFKKRSIPLYALNPMMPFPTTTNTIKFKLAQYGTLNNYAYFSTRVMGLAHDPSYIPGKSPPEIPTAPPQHSPAVPPEVPQTPNVPDFDPIPPEKPADPPPLGPPDPIPPKPDLPQPPGPEEPEVVPPHGPDVIPPEPDIPPPIMGLGSTGFHFY